MKKQLRGFIGGVLVTTLVLGSTISALASSGYMTLEVIPVNIQINGKLFQPKDVNGTDVPVFAYNGTTYAPLRALAEAYGLEVGYNAEANLATVSRASEITNDILAETKSDIKVYEIFPGVPDFGAITGIKLAHWSKYGNTGGCYVYDLAYYAGDEDSIINYLNTVRDFGFEFKPEEHMGKDDGFWFENEQYILYITVDDFLSVYIFKNP